MITNIYYEGEPINKAGVDRVVLSHVELLKINWSTFRSALATSKNIVFDDFKACNRTCYVMEGEDKFHRMTITDPEIGRLSFGANPHRFGIMEFSPASMRNGVNLVNFSGEELIMFLNYAESQLYKRFGITVSFSHCTLKEIELNTTFALEHEFDDYYRTLSVLFSGMPYLKKQCEYNGTEKQEKQLQSYSAFNKQISVTAYNKSLELTSNPNHKEEIHIADEDGVVVEADLMRVEFKLKTAEVCKKWFPGLDTIGELRGEMISTAFENLVKYYFFSPLEKWEAKNRRFLNRLVKECVKHGKKGSRWKLKLLTDLRNEELKDRAVKLLDINDLNATISNYSDKSGHKGRLLLKEDFSGFADDDIFLKKDREKLDEIVGSLKHCIHADGTALIDGVNGSVEKV